MGDSLVVCRVRSGILVALQLCQEVVLSAGTRCAWVPATRVLRLFLCVLVDGICRGSEIRIAVGVGDCEGRVACTIARAGVLARGVIAVELVACVKVRKLSRIHDARV